MEAIFHSLLLQLSQIVNEFTSKLSVEVFFFEKSRFLIPLLNLISKI